MEVSSAGSEAFCSLTTEEQIHCHKARIFSVLTRAPVIRAWRNAICDGAVYLGQGPFPKSYADRYFQVSNKDIRYVTFSIVTAFHESALDAEGNVIESSQCHMTPAQRELSEFLIVTFSNKHDTVSLLPHRFYWPVQGYESTSKEGVSPDDISASSLDAYSFSINCLLANIDEIRRITMSPMHPTTTPFQFGLDGIIPHADFPKAILPQPSGQEVEERRIEEALRIIHRKIHLKCPSMKVDFLDYQPLLLDFKLVISRNVRFPAGLEAMVSFSYGYVNNPDDNHRERLRYADYIFSHGTTLNPNMAFFVPRRLIHEEWFIQPYPEELFPGLIHEDKGRRVRKETFLFKMDDAGNWVQVVWDIINEYPLGEHPTRAEKKQQIWRNAFPWPEFEAQVDLLKDPRLQKTQVDKRPIFKLDSKTSADDAVKHSDVSILAAHYMEKVSMKDQEAKEDPA